jgi:hypothetical protein
MTLFSNFGKFGVLSAGGGSSGPDEEDYNDATGNHVLFANFDETTSIFSLAGNCSQTSTNAKTSLGVTNCLQLDGTGDYASKATMPPHGHALDLRLNLNEAASWEGWFRTTVAQGGTHIGLMNFGGVSWGLIHYGGTDGLYQVFNSSGSAPGVNGGSSELIVDTWCHVAWCRNDAGNCAMFLNGTRIGTSSSAVALGSTGTLYVGKDDPSFNGSDFTGQIGPIRLIIGATPYDPTSSSLTVPTSKFSHVANYG